MRYPFILLLIFAPQWAIAIRLTYPSIICENSVFVKEKPGKTGILVLALRERNFKGEGTFKILLYLNFKEKSPIVFINGSLYSSFSAIPASLSFR